MRAVVIGNIALDETLHVPRLPRPGETLLAERAESDLGGKGANQAVVLARCSVATRLLSRIGRDDAAARLRALLAGEPLDTTGLIDAATATDRSIVLVAADGENAIVSTAACARGLTAAEIDAALSRADLLLLQGNLTEAQTAHGLAAARARGMHTVFNPSPMAQGFAALCGLADLLVCNRVEAEELGLLPIPKAAAQHRTASRVAVTLGAEGAVLHDASGTVAVPAEPTHVRDTTGAGDTFCAVLAAALLVRAMPPQAALRAAARAAAITVSRAGAFAALPTQAELAAILGA